MPDRDESTLAAPIPRIDPAQWEKHEGLRETLLLHYTDPEANETLRRLGDFFYNASLACAPCRAQCAYRGAALSMVNDPGIVRDITSAAAAPRIRVRIEIRDGAHHANERNYTKKNSAHESRSVAFQLSVASFQ